MRVTWYLIILIYIFLRFLNALQAFSFDEFCAHKHAYVHISSYDLFPDIGILYHQVVNQEHAFKHDSMSSTVRIHNPVCASVYFVGSIIRLSIRMAFRYECF